MEKNKKAIKNFILTGTGLDEAVKEALSCIGTVPGGDTISAFIRHCRRMRYSFEYPEEKVKRIIGKEALRWRAGSAPCENPECENWISKRDRKKDIFLCPDCDGNYAPPF
jgi:hypothetical protein